MAAITLGAIGLALAVGTTAYSYASAPGTPQGPDLNAASRAGIEAEAATLPDQRRLQAAAEQGGKTTYTTADQKGVKVTQQFVNVPTTVNNGKVSGPGVIAVPYVASEWQDGGKYFKDGQAAPKIFTKTIKGTKPGETKTADFTGFGEADVQGKVATQNAANQLALEQKYDPQFIAEALKQQELADPQGTAARNKLYDLIQQEAANKPDRPVAALLDKQVGDQLAAGKGLDQISDSVLRDAVAKAQASRGDAGGDPEQFAEPLTTGFAGQARQDAGQQKALSWLTSGQTQEDFDYKRNQQLMADEAAFVNGQSPTSQFKSLANAQNGATPVDRGQPLPTLNPNAGPAAQSAAISANNTYNGAQASQVDPWLTGLSALLHTAGAAGSAGYQPLAKTVG